MLYSISFFDVNLGVKYFVYMKRNLVVFIYLQIWSLQFYIKSFKIVVFVKLILVFFQVFDSFFLFLFINKEMEILGYQKKLNFLINFSRVGNLKGI